jgi:hypothetical protein
MSPVAVGRCATIATWRAAALEQFINQTTGLKTVELADANTEHFHGDLFDLAFLEPVLAHDLLDEIALLLGATPVPAIDGAVRPTVAVAVLTTIGAVAVGPTFWID